MCTKTLNDGVYRAKQRIAKKYGISVGKVIAADKVPDAISQHQVDNNIAIVKDGALFVNGTPDAVIDYGEKENWPVLNTLPGISNFSIKSMMIFMIIWFFGSLLIVFVVMPIFYILGYFALSILGFILDPPSLTSVFSTPSWGEVIIFDHPTLWTCVLIILWTILYVTMAWKEVYAFFRK